MIFFVSLHKNSLQTSKMTEINQYRQELKDRIISYAMPEFYKRGGNYSAPPMGMSNRLTVVLQQELH